ncbi:MAG: hypothetical protein ACW99G_08015 [Candidatus Thorarchaeota archaeon]|jgi:hypothetical protein
MAAIDVNDFTIDYVNKLIRYDGAETTPHPLADMLSVNALYSHLQDTFDELNQMDNPVPMSAQTPTAYTLINGWYIDEMSVQTLKGGAIQTNGWNGEVAVLLVNSITTQAQASDIGKTVEDDASGIGELLHYEAISGTEAKWWIRTDQTVTTGSTMTIASSSADGNANGGSSTGENLWTNLYTLGTLFGTPTLYMVRDDVRMSEWGTPTTQWWDTGHIDILVLIKEAGVELGDDLTTSDTGFVQVYNRTWTHLWDWFEIDLGPGGRQAVPLATANDLNNQTAEGTVATWTDVVISTAGPYSKDIGDGGGAVNYDYSINCGGRPLDEVYERLKWVVRDGNTTDLDGMDGEQYVTVVGQEGTYAPIKAAPIGSFAGGTFFGARGIWIENMAGGDSENYQLIDSAGTTRNPPSQAPITVGGLVWAGGVGDRVLVAKSTGEGLTTIDKSQFTVSGTINSGDDKVYITTSFPADTPASGIIRVLDTGVSEERYTFSAWGANRVFLDSVTSKQYDGPTDTAYVPYIDKETVSGTTSILQSLTYDSNRYLVARVRQYGIIPFETTAELVTGGITITAIRTTDSIVS